MPEKKINKIDKYMIDPEYTQEIDGKIQVLSDDVTGVTQQLADKAGQIEVTTLSNRVSTIIANEGDGTTPTELIDMRVGAKGELYDTAGDALRNVGTKIDTNIVNGLKNSDFSNGTTNWAAAPGGQITALSGVLSIKGTGSGTWPGANQSTNITVNNGDKIYLGALVARKSEAKDVRLGVSAGATIQATSFAPTVDEYTFCQTIITLANQVNGTKATFAINNNPVTSPTSVDTVYTSVKYTMLINLTTAFGVGKEPTLDEMNSILSYFPNKWFDGLLPTGKLSSILYDIQRMHKSQLDSINSQVQATNENNTKLENRIDATEKYSSVLNTTYGTDTLEQKSIRSQLPFRATSHAVVDNFSDMASWTNGSSDLIDGENAKRLISTGLDVGFNKAFASAIALKQYMMLPIEVTNVENLEYVRMTLRPVNGSATNSVKFELLNGLKNGVNYVILNRNESIAIDGAINWSSIRQILFNIKSLTGTTTTVKFGKIETYDMTPLATITFDDGHNSHYLNAWAYMKTKNPPILGCDAIITDNIGVGNHLTLTQLRELIAAGWDIQNHTKNHKNLTTLSVAEAEYQLSRALEYLVGIGAGKGAYHIIPPFYGRNATVDKIVEKYATIQKRADNKYNKMPIMNPYEVQTFSISKTTTVDEVKGWIDTAIANQLWVAFTFHMIMDGTDTYMYPTAQFKEIIDYLDLKKSEIKTVTMSQALYRM